MKKVLQREIWLADLEPVKGSEQGGKRPVVVISGDTLNTTLPISICCPLSSKIKKYPATLLLQPTEENGLETESEIIVFQVRTIAQSRLIKKVGIITPEEGHQILLFLEDLCTL